MDAREQTHIENEIMDHIMRLGLSGAQLCLILAVWRHTYGAGRQEAELPVGFLAGVTGLHPAAVKRELRNLLARRILIVTRERRGKQARMIAFNENAGEWADPLPRSRSAPVNPPSRPSPPTEEPPQPSPLEMEPPPLPSKAAEKPPAEAERPKRKRERRTYDPDSTYYRMAAYFHQKVVEMAESIGFNHASIAKADLQKWADEFRLLVERDGVQDKRLIRDVIDWVTADPFWQVNVLSAKKLREKFPELVLKMKSRGARGTAPPPPGSRPVNNREKSMIDRLAAAQEWIEAGGDPYDFEPD